MLYVRMILWRAFHRRRYRRAKETHRELCVRIGQKQLERGAKKIVLYSSIPKKRRLADRLLEFVSSLGW